DEDLAESAAGRIDTDEADPLAVLLADAQEPILADRLPFPADELRTRRDIGPHDDLIALESTEFLVVGADPEVGGSALVDTKQEGGISEERTWNPVLQDHASIRTAKLDDRKGVAVSHRNEADVEVTDDRAILTRQRQQEAQCGGARASSVRQQKLERLAGIDRP